MIIAECCVKVSHHELRAARAEQERQILQEELWRQEKDFREVHHQNLTEMEELRKFQSSTFDTLTRQKFIEDQNTFGIIRKITRIEKWSKLYERISRLPGRWIGTQWKFSRYQSTDVIP